MPASIKVVSKTTTSIRVCLTGLDSSYAGAQRTCYWSISGPRYSDSGSAPITNGTTSSAYYTFSNLSPNTTYTISAYAEWFSGSNKQTKTFDSVQATTEEEKEKPPTFNWRTDIRPDQPLSVRADDWKLLQDNINKLRVYRGSGSKTFNYRPGSGTTISAAIYNEVAGDLGVSGVSAGTEISAIHFTRLSTAYNNAVGALK